MLYNIYEWVAGTESCYLIQTAVTQEEAQRALLQTRMGYGRRAEIVGTQTSAETFSQAF